MFVEVLDMNKNTRYRYDLVGQDGNSFALMAYTQKAMRECNFTKEEIHNVMEDAMRSDRNHLLCVLSDAIDACNQWCRDNGIKLIVREVIEHEED